MARLSQAAVLGLLSASMAAILLWYALKSPEGDEAAKQKSYVEKDLLDDGDGMSEDEGEEDGGESEDTKLRRISVVLDLRTQRPTGARR